MLDMFRCTKRQENKAKRKKENLKKTFLAFQQVFQQIFSEYIHVHRVSLKFLKSFSPA